VEDSKLNIDGEMPRGNYRYMAFHNTIIDRTWNEC
jgi:hypothetical protein